MRSVQSVAELWFEWTSPFAGPEVEPAEELARSLLDHGPEPYPSNRS